MTGTNTVEELRALLHEADLDRIAWREAAGIMAAALSEIAPETERRLRGMFRCLDWGLTKEEE